MGSTTSTAVQEPQAGAPDAPGRRTPSVRPALFVVGIAAVLVGVFGVGAALTGGHVPRTAPPAAPGHSTTLAAAPAGPALRPIEILGTPPTDVLGALVLPAGSRRLGATPWRGETQFNGSVRFSLPASQAAVVSFFRTELAAHHWRISTVGVAAGHPGATEVLAQMASTDGWYWEAGVVVSPTAFGPHGVGDRTRYSLDLFEVPDGQ